MPFLFPAGRRITRHTLRHTAITHLVQAGVDLPTVQRVSGHKTLQMVCRYSHQNQQHVQAALTKLDDRIITKEPTPAIRRPDYTGITHESGTLDRETLQLIDRLVPAVGIEPTTNGLQNRCSTN